ncbi:MAG: hypothetical protein RLZZ490_864 [Cyanobacteriota bacterium]
MTNWCRRRIGDKLLSLKYCSQIDFSKLSIQLNDGHNPERSASFNPFYLPSLSGLLVRSFWERFWNYQQQNRTCSDRQKVLTSKPQCRLVPREEESAQSELPWSRLNTIYSVLIKSLNTRKNQRTDSPTVPNENIY